MEMVIKGLSRALWNLQSNPKQRPVQYLVGAVLSRN